MIAVPLINWQPIANIPGDRKDGRKMLLWADDDPWIGVWNPETSTGEAWGWTDAREDGVRLSPAYWADINPPA